MREGGFAPHGVEMVQAVYFQTQPGKKNETELLGVVIHPLLKFTQIIKQLAQTWVYSYLYIINLLAKFTSECIILTTKILSFFSGVGPSGTSPPFIQYVIRI